METYIYWVMNDKGGIKAGTTLVEAEELLEDLKSRVLNKEWRIEKHKAGVCPICGEVDDEDTINAFGRCISCEEAD